MFLREPLVAVLPKGHRLESCESISLKELAAERFVLYARENAPELFDSVVSLCKRAKFSPDIADTPSLWQSVLTMVEAGEGLSVVPATVQHLRSQGIVFKRLRDRGCVVEVVLAWIADASDPVRESFLELLHNRQAAVKETVNQH